MVLLRWIWNRRLRCTTRSRRLPVTAIQTGELSTDGKRSGMCNTFVHESPRTLPRAGFANDSYRVKDTVHGQHPAASCYCPVYLIWAVAQLAMHFVVEPLPVDHDRIGSDEDEDYTPPVIAPVMPSVHTVQDISQPEADRLHSRSLLDHYVSGFEEAFRAVIQLQMDCTRYDDA